jgi:hypothetical protein
MLSRGELTMAQHGLPRDALDNGESPAHVRHGALRREQELEKPGLLCYMGEETVDVYSEGCELVARVRRHFTRKWGMFLTRRVMLHAWSPL